METDELSDDEQQSKKKENPDQENYAKQLLQFIKENTEEQKPKKITNVLVLLVVAIGILTTYSIEYFIDKPTFHPGSPGWPYANPETMYQDIRTLKLQVKKLDSTLNKMVPISIDSLQRLNVQNLELTQLKYRIDVLTVQLGNLSSTVLEDPQKALTIPLMNQKVDYITQESLRYQANLQVEVTRIYDNNRWLYGIVITMMVSIVVMNVGNLWKSSHKKE